MNDPLWIWQQPDWPQFNWQAEALAPLLRSCSQAQGRLLGMLGAVGSDTEVQSSLDAMLQNIVTSSAIEGEQLNVGSVRSSLARRLGLHEEGRTTSRSEGLAELLLDATHAHQEPLDEQRLFTWHSWLFPTDDQLLARPLHIGALRGEEPMQVVSGRIDHPTVYFEAPPRAGLEAQLADFLAWFESSRSDASLDPFLRAGIAHFWFVTLHPFDDGNGRLTRAITDLALAQGEQQAIRFYAMSASIPGDHRPGGQERPRAIAAGAGLGYRRARPGVDRRWRAAARPGQAAGTGNRPAGDRRRGAADLRGSRRWPCAGDDGPPLHGPALHRVRWRASSPRSGSSNRYSPKARRWAFACWCWPCCRSA